MNYIKELNMNDLEIEFFNVFFKNIPNDISKDITLKRMSDKSINVEYKTGYQVGRIKLQGRKYYMLIIKNLYEFNTIYEDFNNHIEDWIKYIYKHLLRA